MAGRQQSGTKGERFKSTCELEEGASQAVVTVDSLVIDSETARNPLIRSLHPPQNCFEARAPRISCSRSSPTSPGSCSETPKPPSTSS